MHLEDWLNTPGNGLCGYHAFLLAALAQVHHDSTLSIRTLLSDLVVHQACSSHPSAGAMWRTSSKWRTSATCHFMSGSAPPRGTLSPATVPTIFTYSQFPGCTAHIALHDAHHFYHMRSPLPSPLANPPLIIPPHPDNTDLLYCIGGSRGASHFLPQRVNSSLIADETTAITKVSRSIIATALTQRWSNCAIAAA